MKKHNFNFLSSSVPVVGKLLIMLFVFSVLWPLNAKAQTVLSLPSGQPLVFSWNVSNANSCILSGLGLNSFMNLNSVNPSIWPPNNSLSILPGSVAYPTGFNIIYGQSSYSSAGSTYELNCNDTSGANTLRQTISVKPASSPGSVSVDIEAGINSYDYTDGPLKIEPGNWPVTLVFGASGLPSGATCSLDFPYYNLAQGSPYPTYTANNGAIAGSLSLGNGSEFYPPLGGRTYTLTCKNSGGAVIGSDSVQISNTTSVSAGVKVGTPPSPPAPLIPGSVTGTFSANGMNASSPVPVPSTTPTPSTSYPPGCTSSTGFSATTGQACSGIPNLPPGCTSTSGFSATTGALCSGASASYPAGCTSSYGFSATTGKPCSGTNTPTSTPVTSTPYVPVSTPAPSTATPTNLSSSPNVDLKGNSSDGPVTTSLVSSVKLSWKVSNQTACYKSSLPASEFTGELIPLNIGNQTVYPPIGGITYRITCGDFTDTVSVNGSGASAGYNTVGGTTTGGVSPSATAGSNTTIFALGDKVATTVNLNARAFNNLGSSVSSVVPKGTEGTVYEGPIQDGGEVWYRVTYVNGMSGWSIGKYMSKVSSATTGTGCMAGTLYSATTGQPCGTAGTATPPSVGPGVTQPVDPYAVLPPITSISPATPTSGGIPQFLVASSGLKSGFNVAFVSATDFNKVGGGGSLTSITANGSSGLVAVNLESDTWNVRVTDPVTYNTSPWYVFSTSTGIPSTTPPLAPSPSSSLQINDRVRTIAGLNVRSSGSLNNTPLCTQATGSTGTIIGGPTSGSGYTWWQVDYDAGCDGWSGANYLQLVVATQPATPEGFYAVGPRFILVLGDSGRVQDGETVYPIVSYQKANLFNNGTSDPSNFGLDTGQWLYSVAAGQGEGSPTGLAANRLYSGPLVGWTVLETRGQYDNPSDPIASVYFWNSLSSSVKAAINAVTPSIGARVKLVSVTGYNSLAVRSSGSSSASVVCDQSANATGVVIGGPVQEPGNATVGYGWWQVDYDTGCDGWSPTAYLSTTFYPPFPTVAPNSVDLKVGRGPTPPRGGAVSPDTSGWSDAPASNPYMVTPPEWFLLKWDSANTTSCRWSPPFDGSAGWAMNIPVSTSSANFNNPHVQFGPGDVHYPSASGTTYTLNCTLSSGATVSDSVTVTSNANPPPPPPPPASSGLAVNDRVKVIASPSLNVRPSASLSNTPSCSQPTGATGTIIGGPVSASGYTWWQINYDSGCDGWSGEDYLQVVSGTGTGTTILPASFSCPASASVSPANYNVMIDDFAQVLANLYRTNQWPVGKTGEEVASAAVTQCIGANYANTYRDPIVQRLGVILDSATSIPTGSPVQLGASIRLTANTEVWSNPIAPKTLLETIGTNAEVIIVGGPVQDDGQTWWYTSYRNPLESPNRHGWMKGNNMTVTGGTMVNRTTLPPNGVDLKSTTWGGNLIVTYAPGPVVGRPYSTYDVANVVQYRKVVPYDLGNGAHGWVFGEWRQLPTSFAMRTRNPNTPLPPPRPIENGWTTSPYQPTSGYWGVYDNSGQGNFSPAFKGPLGGMWVDSEMLSEDENTLYDFLKSVILDLPRSPIWTTTLPISPIHVGDRIRLSANTNVRVSAGLDSAVDTILEVQPAGSKGTVAGGPVGTGYNANCAWWQIDYDSGSDGWSANLNMVNDATGAYDINCTRP